MARLIDNLDLLAQAARSADLKRICGVDDEDLADMVRELRAYDPKPGLPLRRRASASAVAPDVLRPPRPRGGWAIELNSATLPRLLVNRRYYAELKRGAAGQGVARPGCSECLAERQLAGEGARPARADDRQGRQRDRQAAGGFFRHGVARAEAADPARGRRGDRDARIDRQPGHLEQISRVRPRHCSS